MNLRTALATGAGVALLLAVGHRPYAANALLIELEPRAGTRPAAVSANNVVVGALAAGGGFYWMPGSDVIFNGGVSSEDVSADGRTIVGIATDAGGSPRRESGLRGPSGGCWALSAPLRRHAATS
jgi:hypothetical protein